MINALNNLTNAAASAALIPSYQLRSAASAPRFEGLRQDTFVRSSQPSRAYTSEYSSEYSSEYTNAAGDSFFKRAR